MVSASATDRRGEPVDGGAGWVRTDLFGDGLITLDPDGVILSANAEAQSMLCIEKPAGIAITALDLKAEGWEDLINAVSEGKHGDLSLRFSGGLSVVAKPRRVPGESHVSLLILQDIEAFEYARDRAFGRKREEGSRFLATERTRPDFDSQRVLSTAMNRVLTRGELAMRQGARVMITGESGVGKSEIARFLHLSVASAHDPFVIVNCASASSERHLDQTLFGREDGNGGFEPGQIEQAEGGTLFLDEVGEIPPGVQARLLWFLEEGRTPTAGGTPRRTANVRVIAATNRDVRRMVREGRFRADLYYRLAVVTLHVPPLRDMQPLVDHLVDRFLHTINQRRATPIVIPKRLREILMDYSFPGNIRELSNIVQRIAVFIETTDDLEDLLSDLIAPMDIPGTDGRDDLPGAATLDLRTEVRKFERTLIDKAIRIHGSKRKAAKALGIDIGTIVRKTT